MSKVVHPFAHRLGTIRDWRHRWFAEGASYRENLKTGVLLREFLLKELRGMYVGGIELERNKSLRVVVKTSRPGLIIGRSGEGSTKLKNSIVAFLKRKKLPVPDLKLDIEEIRSPESSAPIVAYMVAEGLEKRLPFRSVPKQTIRADVEFHRERANLPLGVTGIKVWIYKGDIFANKRDTNPRIRANDTNK